MLRAGDRIGDWVVESPLGSGEWSSVWRCRSRHTPGQKAAVKALRGGEASEQHREAAVLASLEHPGVAAVYACWEDPERGCLFLAMALVEGVRTVTFC